MSLRDAILGAVSSGDLVRDKREACGVPTGMRHREFRHLRGATAFSAPMNTRILVVRGDIHDCGRRQAATTFESLFANSHLRVADRGRPAGTAESLTTLLANIRHAKA